MTQAQHTPGPWGCETNRDGLFPIVYIGPELNFYDNSGKFRARICINEGPTPENVKNGHGFGTTMETANANALLIAAAPDLLEALEELANEIEDTEEHGDGTDGAPECPVCSSIQKSRAVIAKARGQ